MTLTRWANVPNQVYTYIYTSLVGHYSEFSLLSNLHCYHRQQYQVDGTVARLSSYELCSPTHCTRNSWTWTELFLFPLIFRYVPTKVTGPLRAPTDVGMNPAHVQKRRTTWVWRGEDPVIELWAVGWEGDTQTNGLSPYSWFEQNLNSRPCPLNWS